MTSEPVQSMMKKQVKPALMIFFLLTILLGILSPLVITGIAQIVFPLQANGNFVLHDGRIAGSALIGQPVQLFAYRANACRYSPAGIF